MQALTFRAPGQASSIGPHGRPEARPIAARLAHRTASAPMAAVLLAKAALLLLAACPEISVDPTEGPQGAEHMVLAVAGTNTNFVQGTTTASFSGSGGTSGIVIEDVQVDSPSSLRLTVSIPADEQAGPQTLTVTTDAEVASADFTVTQGSGRSPSSQVQRNKERW